MTTSPATGPEPAAVPVEAPKLRRGPHRTLPATPPRRRGSVRRTTSADTVFTDGLLGPILVDLRGRDLHTAADGTTTVLDSLALTIETDFVSATISRVDGGGPELDGLVGLNIRSGWGRQVSQVLAPQVEQRTLLYSALEDLNGAVLVSGYAPLRQGQLERSFDDLAARSEMQADICAGWARGGPLLGTLLEDGVSPVPMGPAGGDLEAGDPIGWHEMAPLAFGTVRRRRRLDLWRVGERWRVDSHFRDTYRADDIEMVMHEYVLDATIDAGGLVVAVEADDRVLPWYECPQALDSAQRVVGAAIEDVPRRVRAEMTGNTTCTHLNSTSRCLADAGPLRAVLEP